ncbi:DUF3732 domain-containing protein [Rossellomorea sp. LjRoot5]|uniref:DUF3732 domain-containing protein n=1 Tax=Rossellomorea sp. LjRoot5 TaxID=3342331 RepID=UPI003ECFCBAF
MKSWISGIILFNKKGEKREVQLTQGLNIITGESKSGKSALLEIIDYCFGSYYSTIPKGIITNFTHLYVLTIKIENSTLVIGRKAYNDGGRTRMFIKVEPREIDFQQLNIDYFSDEYFVKRTLAVIEIEKNLGMNLTDLSDDSSANKRVGKPSLRNMMSYLLQHQNLVASKFALFYRFDDHRKKEQVIGQFPIFSGWVDQEYYTLKYQLDLLEKELKVKESETAKRKDYIKIKEEFLKDLYKDYFKLIGEEINVEKYRLHDLYDLKEKLPAFSIESYINSEIRERYKELQDTLESKRKIIHKHELTLSNLEDSEKYGHDYLNNLDKLKSRSKAAKPLLDEYNCPLCGNSNIETNETIKSIKKSMNWLQEEISEVNYRKGSLSEKITNIKDKINKVKNEVKGILDQINEIEKYYRGIDEGKNMQEQILYAKARIQTETEYVENTLTRFKDEDTTFIQDEVDELRFQINRYNLEQYYLEAMSEINTNMNKVIDKLDFEDEFKPANMYFDLKETFELYFFDKKNNSKIYLSEMGSGANWLACHIGLFLSLQRYFCSIKNSPIPKFLFFDQPSQVYFPDTSVDENDKKNNTDIMAVKKVYKAFLDEITSIKDQIGYEPQIIVTDHVKSLDIEGYDFNSYIQKYWFDGEKLI